MKYFIYNIENLTDSEYEKWFSLMTKEKQDRVSRYKDFERRKCSVAGEKLVKEYIGKSLNISPEALVVLANKNGKPYIENCPIHFNISHCENTLIYAFSDKEIGIDIEKIRPISHSVLNRFFSTEEQEFVLGKASNESESEDYYKPQILENFYRIYTLKEAICKKSGIGIKGLKAAEALHLIDHSFKENDFIISIV